MKPLVPYLFFDGNCREAMNFYQRCFGGKLELMTFGDSPDQDTFADAAKDAIMHGSLNEGDFCLMASDHPNGTPVSGDNAHLNVQCETKPETDKLFGALSEGGKVTMPLADAFWGAYFGCLTDKYGIHWMLNCPLKN